MYFNKVDIHLIYRDFDYDNKDLLDLIEKITYLRDAKKERMIEYVENVYNIKLDRNLVEEVSSKTNSFGKPHLYKILSLMGNYDREEYYRKMDKLKTSNLKLDAKEVLMRLKDSKGYVTLAHPIEVMREYDFSYIDIDNLVKELVALGLKGLEVKHFKHNKQDYEVFSEIAKKYNLIETCGSDYHGENVKPGLKVGDILKI